MEKEAESRVFRRSLFVVKDMKLGEVFTEDNIRSNPSGYGLSTKHIGVILGKNETVY